MSAEIPTPRTDAKEKSLEWWQINCDDNVSLVSAKFARQLERDLAAANQREAGLRAALASARTQLMAHGHAENCISCALSVIDAAILSAATGGVEKTG